MVPAQYLGTIALTDLICLAGRTPPHFLKIIQGYNFIVIRKFLFISDFIIISGFTRSPIKEEKHPNPFSPLPGSLIQPHAGGGHGGQPSSPAQVQKNLDC